MASVAAAARRFRRTSEPSASAAARRPPVEHRLLLTATLCLLAGGAVMVYSASAPSELTGGSGTGALVRFVVFAAGGLVVLRFASQLRLDVVRRLTGPLLGIAFLALLAVRVPGIGHSTVGALKAERWIGVGPLQFEPSELMKLALVLYAAHIFALGRTSVRSVKTAFKRLVLVGGAACLLVATQPDIGTTLVIAFAMVAVVLVAGVPMRWLVVAGLAAIALVGIFALAEPYAAQRLTSFTDPWAHAQTSGFQSVQSQIAIGSGGLLGRGPGQSLQKDYWLPEAPTDFILAVVGEELGFVGIAGLLTLYGMISFAGLRAARATQDPYRALIAVGVTALIVFQAALNAFAVLGIAPVTGVPLPFVSYGASNMLVLLAGMGLLLNVARGDRAHMRAVTRTPSAKPRRSEDVRSGADRDRGGRDGGARRAGARGRGRAARSGS
jgi:cell division protein FtsW